MADPAISIRDQRSADRSAVRQLLTGAFGRVEVADLAEQLHRLDGPGAQLVAESGGVIVGQVQLSRGWIDSPSALVDVAVLSPLGVLPASQGRGIGSRLVVAAIGRAEALGLPALFLEGSPGFYFRFGFRPGAQQGFRPPSVRIPVPAFQGLRLPGWQRWMTGALVYPDVFWRLDCVGVRPG